MKIVRRLLSTVSHTIGVYNDIHITDPRVLKNSDGNGAALLTTTLAHFKETVKQPYSVWLSIPKEGFEVLSVAAANGFEPAVVSPNGELVFSLWQCDSGRKSPLPCGATHHMGAAAMVLNKAGKVLAIQEQHGRAAGMWKLPGGKIDFGELYPTAVEREVLEETGIHCKFNKILAIVESLHSDTHQQIIRAGFCDWYVIAAATPIDEDAPLQPQESEIAKVAWLDIEELTAVVRQHDFWNKMYTMCHKQWDAGEGLVYEPKVSQKGGFFTLTSMQDEAGAPAR
eukprot:TRINITY_DN67092_c6_g12_i1.p1 TRINITY_DN67092_c6_g12~~TRINITY_DN67092_c6_g12_i1.p1  ORF type:complete len:283 (-),score=44.15 TRINITY_DN67092_c6_g12_i1:406-1254(-)